MLHDLKRISQTSRKGCIEAKIRSQRNKIVEGRLSEQRVSLREKIDRIDDMEDKLDALIEKLDPMEREYSKLLAKIDDIFDPVYKKLSKLGILDERSEFASKQLIGLKEKEHKAIMTLQRIVVRIEEELEDHARRLRRIKSTYKRQLRKM